MIIQRILPYTHYLMKQALSPGDQAIDATVGNGHDTLLLAKLVGDTGKVYGFDIQRQALQNTKALLQEHQMDNRVTLFQESHDKMKELLPPEAIGNIGCAVFNLGYLPGSDKSITTTANSTIDAIEQLLEIIKVNGLILIVVYHGHEEGKKEKEALLRYLSALDQKFVDVLKYSFINQKNDPPFLLVAQKKK